MYSRGLKTEITTQINDLFYIILFLKKQYYHNLYIQGIHVKYRMQEYIRILDDYDKNLFSVHCILYMFYNMQNYRSIFQKNECILLQYQCCFHTRSKYGSFSPSFFLRDKIQGIPLFFPYWMITYMSIYHKIVTSDAINIVLMRTILFNLHLKIFQLQCSDLSILLFRACFYSLFL